MRLGWFVAVALLAACEESSSGGAGAEGGALPSGGAGGGGDASGGHGGGGAGGTGGSAGGAAPLALPTADARFDYQLGGAYAPPRGVAMVVRDRGEAPAEGLYSVCYVNGFQIQEAEESFWLDEHPTLVLRDQGGAPIVDPDWDEMLLDVGDAAKRDAIAAIVGDWIAGCAQGGFAGVEIDNLDSYTRSDGLLEQADAVAYMALLSARAHAEGLAIAQKNSVELLGEAAAMGTDFAIAEECNRYDECQEYQSAYGDRVFVVEYRAMDFEQGCADFPGLSIVLRDLLLVKPDEDGYVFDDC
jgi:hypothetical protein